MKCVICGKELPSNSTGTSQTCSKKCSQAKRIIAKDFNVPKRPVLHSNNFDVSKAIVAKDYSVQKSMIKALLDSLEIRYTEDFVLCNYTYDIRLLDQPVLICIDSTLVYSTIAIPECPRIQRDRTLIADIFGYRCIHIYDWNDPMKVIGSLVPDKVKISAEHCWVCPIPAELADQFYSMYYITTETPSKHDIDLGLHVGEKLLQCMTIKRTPANNSCTILRCCTDFNFVVVGGVSKMLKYLKDNYHPSTIITYCDTNKFRGDVYEKVGMKPKGGAQPIRVWSKGIEMQYNMALDSATLSSMFNCTVDADASRDAVLLEHGWLPIYINGKAKYVWEAE